MECEYCKGKREIKQEKMLAHFKKYHFEEVDKILDLYFGLDESFRVVLPIFSKKNISFKEFIDVSIKMREAKDYFGVEFLTRYIDDESFVEGFDKCLELLRNKNIKREQGD